jgi:hypothetical protein
VACADTKTIIPQAKLVEKVNPWASLYMLSKNSHNSLGCDFEVYLKRSDWTKVMASIIEAEIKELQNINPLSLFPRRNPDPTSFLDRFRRDKPAMSLPQVKEV